MDPEDITEWASTEIKIIEVTQGFSEVREFIPVEGDLLEESWNSGGIVKRHKCPPYAVANVEKAAQDLRQFIDDNISAYIIGAVGQSDILLWSTYYMAFKQSKEAPVSHAKLVSAAQGGLLTKLVSRTKSEHSSRMPSASGAQLARPVTQNGYAAKKRLEHLQWTIPQAHGLRAFQSLPSWSRSMR